jgi:GTP-binding protein Era
MKGLCVVKQDNHPSYCGLIAIVGRPNVGKSTLMNHLIGQKISITSRKPQTTQYKIQGIHTQDNYQYVFVDTPGFQTRYINKINTLLNQSVVSSLADIDVVLFVVEAGLFNEGDQNVLALLNQNHNVILVVNKEDKLKDPSQLKQFLKQMGERFKFKRVCQVSAKHHRGVDELLVAVREFLPAADFLYAADDLTNRSNTFMAQEIIREKLFRYLGEELPYNIAVTVNQFQTTDKLIRVAATIWVERDSYKGIVIGKAGERLKKISSQSRLDMEKLYGNKVFLEVWVKVKAGLLDDKQFLEQFI